MTEKRFRLSNEKYNETIFDNGVAMGIIDVVEKLNELAEENMMLKGENAHYKLLLMSLEETAKKFCEIPKVK